MEHRFTGAFICPRQYRAHHHRGGADRQRLGHVAGIGDATIGDHRNPAPQGLGRAIDGSDLRDANSGNHAGGADRSRTDAHLDGVRPGLQQVESRFGAADVAGDDIDLGIQLLEPGDCLHDPLGMAVGGIDHQCIDLGGHQELAAPVVIGADRRRHPQPVLVIAVEMRLDLLGDADHIGKTVKTLEAAGGIDDRKLADPVFHHQLVGLRHGGGLGGGEHQRSHHLFHLDISIGQKFHVARGQNADQAIIVIEDRESGELVVARRFLGEDFGDQHSLAKEDRGLDQAMQEMLDPLDLFRLFFRGQVLVDHPDAAAHRHGNRHPAFRDRVHRRADKRAVELDVAGKQRADIGLIRQDVRIQCFHGDIVEGQRLKTGARHELVQMRVVHHR